MHRYLVLYYDGNENLACIVRATDRTSVPGYIASTAAHHDWDVLLILELHHDYFDGGPNDWTAELVIDDVPYNIQALPEFGAE